ncbi:MAG TPA: hypothetical protein VGO57_03075 [Verrucomicrobiae bacterium]
MATFFSLLLLASGIAQAQINVLSNPGGETGDYTSWTVYNNAGYNFNVVTNVGSGAIIPPRTGNYCFFIYGDYNMATEYNGIYQKAPAHAGQIFTADGWVYQLGTDSFNNSGDGNNAFLEVTFLDINSATLARYRSASIVNGSTTDLWIDMSVTNQLDPNTYAAIGSVTNLVAPAGTVQVEYNLVFNLVNYGGGSTYWDDLSLLSYSPPPPYITNVAPNVILATNNNLTFNVVAQNGTITNIQLTVKSVTGLANPITNTVTYTSPSTNFTVVGLNTVTASVSYPLASNTTYTVTIQATDSNQDTALANAAFDTMSPVLVWEAEDFNYNSGQFLTTPANGGAGLYAGLVGTEGIDEHKIGGPTANGGGAFHFYRPTDAVSIQAANELPRQKYIDGIAAGNTNAIDEEVGYNSPGDWINWTRNFPAGDYNIYARLSTSGSGTMLNFGLVTGDPTSSSQSVTNLGIFSFTDDSFGTYKYVPLQDNFGNLVTVHLNGQQTLRSTVVGNPNISFFMLMPATGSPYPALLSSYPTGLHPFEPGTQLTFSIGPANGSVINSSAIGVTLNGQDMTSHLTITAGTANSWNASLPISSNAIYSAVINVTNTTELSSHFAINFDTFSQSNFMWEAEDFDFNGGQFIDNPVPTADNVLIVGQTPPLANGTLAGDSYYGLPGGGNQSTYGIDFTTQGKSDTAQEYYRFDDCGTEFSTDFIRQKFLDARTASGDQNITDFDVGWWNAGWWLNYTRTYPTGRFYVYGRLAGGAGAFSGTSLSIVTNGVGTSLQSSNVIGSFADPNAAGWATWHWVPMLDANNQMAVITLGGQATLKLTSGGNLNANYYMLVPAPATANFFSATVAINNQQPAVSFPTQNGFTYTLVYKNDLTDTGWSTVTSVPGDGSVKTLTDTTATGVAHRFYAVQAQ